ncbi:MAG: DUF2493 domain-containing protein [Proteobacteria bacterium]|nr:DUF2493 domain-containing protein [Pseudomonadota bacterium]
MTHPFRAPNGFSPASQTARAIDSVYGMHIADEPDTRPMPEAEQLEAAASSLFAALSDNFSDTGMEAELEDLAWSLVDLFHRKADRLQRFLDSNELRQKDLHDQQDGSEVMSVELERETDKGRTLLDKRDCVERLRDLASEEFQKLTGSAWRARTRSVVNHRNMTAAMIDSRDFRNAKRYAETHVLLPKGPTVVFSGGKDFNDVQKIWAVLDKVHMKHPDMVLVHSAKTTGADKIAACWAQSRKVPEVGFGLGSGAYDNTAGFKRNERMLETKPIGVVVFPGPGTVLNVATKARQLGLTILDMTGA